MPFKFTRVSEIPDLIIIEPTVFEDNRGFFMETYSYREFERVGIKEKFVQDNHSKSVKGVLRGLHFQIEPFAQSKLVRCIKGEIFDVAVDIRPESATFKKWFGLILSEENKKMLYIPKGFAHGFVVLSEVAEVEYKVDNFYSPEHERGIIWNDPEIGIKWPFENPILSPKDMNLPNLSKLMEELLS
ncbi:dTDP-4-dehydrorhamnose 3,5-epimerase [Candidatus Kryptobacter tengchongensis]|uniref:dTDP-4-dehydrorhamnose 3,5-epimerase n=1 Tax=Kryptobacter tengchongensis TaxID=1643429 RepID=A0A916LID7_KRYT1|nr:dTDP-4-dehydrorhamnose 3,5-epimerase [Candidatus Kryptobacter tengchongensis]CUS97443.1 dTDP-4-dehydrorhamnose 3,5-epimerase [Candidatus Kryptobacter tengchongensis]